MKLKLFTFLLLFGKGIFIKTNKEKINVIKELDNNKVDISAMLFTLISKEKIIKNRFVPRESEKIDSLLFSKPCSVDAIVVFKFVNIK